MRRDVPLEDRFRPDLVAPLVCALLADGASPEIPVRGNSMLPILRDGDRVRLAPVTHAGARLGDVVLRVEPSGPVIHRVVGWWPSWSGWRLLTKGDGANRLDAPLPPEHLAGRVMARVRGGSVQRLDGTGMRIRAWSRAVRSLMVGVIVEAWDRARGRRRSGNV
jgi:signal peptidase I